MPLKLFDTKDAIPEAQREGAVETKDGKFAIVEDADTSGLQSSLDKERRRADAAEALARKAAADLKKKETDDKAGAAGITDEKLQEIRGAVRKEVEAEYAPKITAGEVALKENRSLKLDNQVKQLAAKAGFLGDKLDDYWKLHGDEFDLTDDGKPMVKASPGTSVEKLIETHKGKRPEWVQGTKGDGGGAAGASGGAPAGPSGLTADDILKNPGRAFEAANK